MKSQINYFLDQFKKDILLDEKLSKYSWFNIGGPAEILFRPSDKEQLKHFLIDLKDSHKITCLGAGSNTLFRDGGVKGVVIKLGSNFSFIKKLDDINIEVGAATLDKVLSTYTAENSIAGFEFLSCIPGSIGGAIIMNSGCYGQNISDVLISINVIDFNGREREIKKDDIKFFYRETSLPNELIITSAKLKGVNENSQKIFNKIKRYQEEKKNTQPSRIKTCGSTFKNPLNEKAWRLIKNSGCENISFGKASISKKHCNFFVNEGGASSDEIEKLINFVREKVYHKYKIKLDLEIKLIGEPLNNV